MHVANAVGVLCFGVKDHDVSIIAGQKETLGLKIEQPGRIGAAHRDPPLYIHMPSHHAQRVDQRQPGFHTAGRQQRHQPVAGAVTHCAFVGGWHVNLQAEVGRLFQRLRLGHKSHRGVVGGNDVQITPGKATPQRTLMAGIADRRRHKERQRGNRIAPVDFVGMAEVCQTDLAKGFDTPRLGGPDRCDALGTGVVKDQRAATGYFGHRHGKFDSRSFGGSGIILGKSREAMFILRG